MVKLVASAAAAQLNENIQGLAHGGLWCKCDTAVFRVIGFGANI